MGATLPSLLDAARIFALRKTWEYAREHSRYYAAKLPRRSADDIDLATRTVIMKMQPREREELLQGLREDGPEGYREFIRDYFRRLTKVHGSDQQ